MLPPDILDEFRIAPGETVRLEEHPTDWKHIGSLDGHGRQRLRKKAEKLLKENRRELAEVQRRLYADNRYSLLVVLQAMDAAGKDGTIRHVMSGVNPQGCQVYSFKRPSAEELDHSYLWRFMTRLPERGRIGIFNRSHYEDVLVVKVHPELVHMRPLPPGPEGEEFWNQRYEDINAFEQHLARNGIVVVKLFLHLSQEEQKERFFKRLDRPEKHWKFSAADLAERRCWDEYQRAYEEALTATSTPWAPWYVVPADRKWAARAIVSSILIRSLNELDLKYPTLNDEERAARVTARQELEQEAD